MRWLTNALEFLLEVDQVLAIGDTKKEVWVGALFNEVFGVRPPDGQDGGEAVRSWCLLDGFKARHSGKFL